MARTITETIEEQNSVEVTRDAKGQFKYVIKVYFAEHADYDATERVERIMADLRARFEPLGHAAD